MWARSCSPISPSAAIWAGPSGSSTRCLTAATWPGAAATTFSQPGSVRIALVYRPSPGSGSRRTNPRCSSRLITFDSRDREPPLSSASSLIRDVRSGAMDSRLSTMYSNRLMPDSRCSWASSAPGSCTMRWAHGDQFSVEDTYRTLDTMERLLVAAGAAEQAGQVRGLRLDLQQPETGGTASSADRDSARPQRPAPPQPGHPAGFWSPVERADVVRAIEDYDRLGQDRFLAEHGFGRATAYLLIYRGRSYDS